MTSLPKPLNLSVLKPGTPANDCAKEVVQGAFNGVVGGVGIALWGGAIYSFAYDFSPAFSKVQWEEVGWDTLTLAGGMTTYRASKNLQFKALQPRQPRPQVRRSAYRVGVAATFAGLAMALNSLSAPAPQAPSPWLENSTLKRDLRQDSLCQGVRVETENGQPVLVVPQGCKMT